MEIGNDDDVDVGVDIGVAFPFIWLILSETLVSPVAAI